MNLKSKPVLIGGGVVLFLIILYALNKGADGGGSAGTQFVNTGPSSEQLQAQTSLALAQIDAGKTAGQTSAQVAIARESLAADLSKSVMQADVTKYLADREANNQALGLTVNAKIAAENTAAQVATTKYLGDLSLMTTKAQLDQAERLQVSNNNFQLDYAESANQSLTQLAGISANLTMAQLASNRDITLGVLNTNAQLEATRILADRDAELGKVAAQERIITLTTTTERDTNLAAIAAATTQYNIAAQVQADRNAAVISSLPSLKKKNRDDVLKTFLSGEYGYAGPPVSGTAQTIGAIGGAAGSFAKLAGAFF